MQKSCFIERIRIFQNPSMRIDPLVALTCGWAENRRFSLFPTQQAKVLKGCGRASRAVGQYWWFHVGT